MKEWMWGKRGGRRIIQYNIKANIIDTIIRFGFWHGDFNRIATQLTPRVDQKSKQAPRVIESHWANESHRLALWQVITHPRAAALRTYITMLVRATHATCHMLTQQFACTGQHKRPQAATATTRGECREKKSTRNICNIWQMSTPRIRATIWWDVIIESPSKSA